MKQTFNLIATAAAGLEAVVGREVRALGYDCQVENGRVRFEGDVKTIIETNLWLRAADRIKIVVGTFPAKTFEELFQGVFALDWENYLPLGARFPISKAKCVKSKLHNEPSVQAISKKAVVKKLQKHYARPEGVPLMENGPEFRIEVSILKDVATIMIDTSGSSLFKRGYRTEKGGAPIKENMAAAILQLSNWYPDKPLIDPTCGSGTFCIEAAMIARKIAPGLRRSFAFEEWNWVSDRLIQEVRTKASKKINREIELDIMGCDIDGRMVEIADRQELYDNPMHPYTKALLSAIPVPDVDVNHEPILLEGDIPSPYNPPKGCLFHTRCKYAMECCKNEVPQMRQIGENHCVACHLYDKTEKE